MKIPDKPYAEQWIENLRAASRCNWCGIEHNRLNRRGLCPSCNEIRKKLEFAKEQLPKKQGEEIFPVRMEIAIRELEMENCVAHGNELKRILTGEIDGLKIERKLSQLSRRIVKKDLFDGKATLLGLSFNKAQQQLLAYFFWTIISGDARKNRHIVAQSKAIRRMTESQE